MLGWILGGIAAAALLSNDHPSTSASNNSYEIAAENRRLYRENERLRENNTSLQYENARLKLTIYNQQKLLKNYDYVNRFSKTIGYNSAVSFFYYLAEAHDSKFGHYAKFLNKVRCMRNDVAHNGSIYDIDTRFLNSLEFCKTVCDKYETLSYNDYLRLR